MVIETANTELTAAGGAEPSYRRQYRLLESLTRLVALGKANGLVVVGIPGVAKSHTVLKTLTHLNLVEGTHFSVFKGHTSPLGLFISLWEQQQRGDVSQLIVYDDCDSALANKDGLNLVKAALDTKPRRIISFVSSKLPSGIPTKFEFSGRIIFISNLRLSQINDAVCDRVMTAEINLSRSELFQFIELEVLPHEYLDTTLGQRAYVLKQMQAALHHSTVRVSVRLYRKLLDLWCHDRDNFHLHLDALLPRNSEFHMLRRLLDQADTVGEAATKYHEVTGKSERTFYLLKSRYRDYLD